MNKIELKIKTNKLDCKTLISFRLELWLLCIIAACFSTGFAPFISIARSMITQLWGMDPYIASICTSVVYDIALVFAIPVGRLVDVVGHRLTMLAVACTLILIGHILFISC